MYLKHLNQISSEKNVTLRKVTYVVCPNCCTCIITCKIEYVCSCLGVSIVAEVSEEGQVLILLNVPAPALEAKVTVLCVPSLLIYTLNVPDLPTAGHAESVKITSAPTVTIGRVSVWEVYV